MIDEELRQRWEEEAGQYPALVADVFNGALKEANRVVGKSTKAEVKKFIINTVTEAIQAGIGRRTARRRPEWDCE